MIETLTDDNFEDLLQKNRVSVVKVQADWCGPCKLLKPHFLRWTKNYYVYNDTRIKYYEINNDQNRKFTEKYKTTHLPSILFFVHGVHVFTIRGMTRVKVFEEVLKQTLEVKFDIKE